MRFPAPPASPRTFPSELSFRVKIMKFLSRGRIGGKFVKKTANEMKNSRGTLCAYNTAENRIHP